MSARNVFGAPPHHPDCVICHSTRKYPCFPTSKDAFTLRQKKWLQENKENIPPQGSVQTLKKTDAFHYKDYTIQDRRHVKEEDIELDVEEET